MRRAERGAEVDVALNGRSQPPTTRCRAPVTSGRIDGLVTVGYDGARAASQAAETTGLDDIAVCRRLRGAGFPVVGSSATGGEVAGAGGKAVLTTGKTLTVTVSQQDGADSVGGGGSLVIDAVMSKWAVASGGNAVAPLDGASPHLALRSLIDDGLREVNRRAPRPARCWTRRHR